MYQEWMESVPLDVTLENRIRELERRIEKGEFKVGMKHI